MNRHDHCGRSASTHRRHAESILHSIIETELIYPKSLNEDAINNRFVCSHLVVSMYGRSVVSDAINHTLAYPWHFDTYRPLVKTIMLELQPKDKRGYFMLPQAPEGAGYYVYGNVGGRLNTGHQAQYAHPNLMTLILCIEREWQAIDERKFGIGNISVAGGAEYDGHVTHQKGLEMDIRPVRKDKLTGQEARLTRFDAAYDREATTRLIRLFARHMMVRTIYFNDTEVQKAIGGGRVRSAIRHDDHFHVEIRRYA